MSDKTLPITGGCMCGALRYEATEPPQGVGDCHCRICQKCTGNLFYSYAAFREAAFRITQGEPKFYKSSAWLERGFCASCGTQVCDRYLKGSYRVSATIGSLDHPEDWPPSMHCGVESQIPWLTIHDDLPRMRTEEDPEFVAA
jgi:hypothetical protein